MTSKSSEPVQFSKPARFSKIIGFLLLVIASAILLYFTLQGDRQEDCISQGFDHLHQGCTSHSSQPVVQAKAYFIKASRFGFFDSYPPFLVQAADEIEQVMTGRLAANDPFFSSIQAISMGQYKLARHYLLELSKRSGLENRLNYYLRLVTELERRSYS